MTPNEIDLKSATKMFVVSNTPLFLLRKLQSDPSVYELGQNCSGEEILEAIRSTLPTDPQSPEDAVRPYAYLVSLWYKSDDKYLKEAHAMESLNYPWFSDIASALRQGFNPVQKQMIEVPCYYEQPAVLIKSDAETNVQVILGTAPGGNSR